MATSIVMPKMSYDMQQGTVVRWLKDEGDTISSGEVIAEIETDKATVEMPAYVNGVMGRIVVEIGRSVPVGELIAVITQEGETLPPAEILSSESPAPEPLSTLVANLVDAPAPAPERVAEAPASPATTAAAPAGEVRASPIARRLARERGIDLTQVTGSGPGGRIVEADVLALPAGGPAEPPAGATAEVASPAGSSSLALSRMRQAIARVTVQSKQEAPHFYVTAEVDMTQAMALRRQINESLGQDGHVTVNDMVVRAAALALQSHPRFNASFKGDHLELHADANVGIAIALSEGLIIASVPGCQKRSLAQIAEASRDLARRAEGGALRAEEYETTFSISNMGMFDVDSFSAIIYPPNAAVLAIASVKEQPVARDGQLAVAQMMRATLSVDHRVADGAEAARFLVDIKALLEQPVRLLI